MVQKEDRPPKMERQWYRLMLAIIGIEGTKSQMKSLSYFHDVECFSYRNFVLK